MNSMSRQRIARLGALALSLHACDDSQHRVPGGCRGPACTSPDGAGIAEVGAGGIEPHDGMAMPEGGDDADAADGLDASSDALTDPLVGVGSAQKVAGGFSLAEGPLWDPQAARLFLTDFPEDRIYQLEAPVTVTLFREPSGAANGLALDPQGRLIACEHSGRRVSRTSASGVVETVASHYLGLPFNSPNDAVVRKDGTLYFTDPPYGGNPNVLGFQGVYRVEPSGTLHLVADDMFRPNGIALSADQTKLYVSDSEHDYVRRYALSESGEASQPAKFADVPSPDGMAVDVQDYLYVTAATGIEVYNPAGALHGTLTLPEEPANCAFGGPDWKTLYVTAKTSLYRFKMTVPGAQ